METTTLSWLNMEELKILKEIVLVSERNNLETDIGSIFYSRQLTTEYNFIKQQEDDKKEPDQISRIINGYPKQKNYPEDEIDLIILESVKKNYPKSVVRNDTIFFNIDLKKISDLKKRKSVQAKIFFSPEFSNLFNVYEYVGKEFPAPTVIINVYNNYSEGIFKTLIFYAEYNFKQENLLDKLRLINFE